jgi:PAS domain S-box-containing protein
MHGYSSPEEMIAGVTDLDHQIFVDPEQRREFRGEMEKAGIVRGREYQVYRKDGSKFWIAVDARAVRDETGAISYYEGFIQDITDRKERQSVWWWRKGESRMQISSAPQFLALTRTCPQNTLK